MSKGNATKLLGAATLGLMVAALFMVFVYAPAEAAQGDVQRIFYFHVPLAWVAFAAFAITAVAGLFYLWLGYPVFDQLAYAAAEAGVVFCTLVLVTGSLWARPIWGTWWTWDSRLTSTFILWLLYVGYLALRAALADGEQGARMGAVFGLVAAADVPVVVVSVRLWRTIHPAVLVTREGSHGLADARMVATLLVSMVAVTAVFGWLLALRVATLRAEARLHGLAAELLALERASEEN